jgi:DNA-binding NarL/FixJ family response regulator
MVTQLIKQQWAEIQEIAILLIEDFPGDAAAITKALLYGETLYSFTIQHRNKLSEGLDYLSAHPVDAVLLDLGLPDAMNLTGLTALHARFPEIPVVIVSGRSDINTVHAALKSGAQEFLIKGECSGAVIRQSIYQAIARKKIELSYQRGEKL